MMARKARITLIVISIIIIILIITGILAFLYLKTDTFKSNEELFAKYLMKGFDAIDIVKNEDTLGIENTLETNKYTSELKGSVEYTTNKGTDSEDKNSSINQIGLNVKSNIDKANNYKYQNISIGSENENYIGLEYLKENENYGIRLKDVKQFISNNDSEEKLLKDIGIQNFNIITSDIDINSILNFSEQEKQTLMNTYAGTIRANISINKFYKQTNTLITMSNGDTQTNAYYIKMTIEEYNNLYIKILEKLEKDEIILSRIDLIEKAIKQKYPDYTSDTSMKDTFVKNIEDKIKDIQNNNIGSDEVKITVYESKGNTVRFAVEKQTEKLLIDRINDTEVKIDISELGYETKEKTIKIEKNNKETENQLTVEYENKKNDEVLKNIQLECDQSLDNDKINKKIKLLISNKKYEGILNFEDNIKLVQNFENEVNLDNDNIGISTINDEQANIIVGVLKENIQEQFDNLYAVASKNEYKEMLQNLEVIGKDSIQISENGEVTDTERKRFNSQFEFFASENLTSDNIKELISTAKNNLSDIKVALKNGEVQDLDIDKIDSSEDSEDYKKEILGIVFYIKPNSNNDNKVDNITKFIDEYVNNEKYTVTLEYDSNGLVKTVNAKIQDEN